MFDSNDISRLHNASYTQCRPVGTIVSLSGDSTQARGWGGFRVLLGLNIGSPPSIVPPSHHFISLVKTFYKLCILLRTYLQALNPGGMRGITPICSTRHCFQAMRGNERNRVFLA